MYFAFVQLAHETFFLLWVNIAQNFPSFFSFVLFFFFFSLPQRAIGKNSKDANSTQCVPMKDLKFVLVKNRLFVQVGSCSIM